MPPVPVIAVVDDDPAIREAMDDLIMSFGYQCRLFASAEQFLDAQQQADIDCIVVDVKMPGLSGIELQSELNRRGEHAPMIFVTSYEDDRTRNAALSGGALAFLRKPVNIGKLMGCLESVLGPQP
ncbi:MULTISPECIES: response regulator transcription factor [Rhizobium/Agrobacterium group]|uniref:Response regulator n=3 Tax=Hyphomicrobiales TaxID=356 RepID=A0A1S9E460_9HYPH|nr:MULTISPECIES: response regulator [Rhizobium/Agrobacterium group]AMD57020.1 two-component system response regulator [Agrobacterium tumefaciens]ANV25682.1 two-component system response regulator [Rhizobium sp. S41]AUC12966.1 two-component system response regulator [Rhizobium sp. Y9]EKJ93184.1 two component response regulator [Bradyrhizobium lupini HPC(L)]KGE80593.1 chemotaxis protein CheY [Rhizobium sp. H41]KIV67054.1 Two-component response regulator [Rhizobium sp. UR51a]MBB2906473.1 FixJ f